jgi:hypothetical protein
MPCECAEQPLSSSTLKDTGVPTPIEIMMAGSPEDIYLFAYSLQSPETRGGLRAVPSREGGAEPRGHMVTLELPRAESESPSRGDMWRPRSCPEPRAGARAMGTHGSPGVAPSWEWEPEPRGHMAASELPSTGRREPLSWLEACAREPLSWPTSGKAANPWVGPTPFPAQPF